MSRGKSTWRREQLNARPEARGGINSVNVKHSRGPWRVLETEAGTAIRDADDRSVAYVPAGPRQSDDAALIVAGPALLKLALQYASECGECCGVGVTVENRDCEDCRDIRDAIADATSGAAGSSGHVEQHRHARYEVEKSPIQTKGSA